MPTTRIARPCAALLSLALAGCAMNAPYALRDAGHLTSVGSQEAAPRAADTATPAGPAAAPAAAAGETADATARLMIYSAEMNLVVSSIDQSLASVKRTGESLGGYVQELSADRITLKVPAARFDEAIQAVRRLGEVADQRIVAADVTEQMLDLRIRLDTAEKMRTRLLALLEKAEKVEDALKIEQELARTVETIEQIKGRIRLLSNQIAYSTLIVRFNSPIPQDQLRELTPFPWVQRLGGDLVDGTRPAHVERGWFSGGIALDAPAGYVRYYADKQETRLMNAAGVLTRTARHENYPGGSLDFWSDLIRLALVRSRAIALDAGERITLADGTPATLLTGEKTIGDQRSGYLIVIAVKGDDRICTYEAWGPIEPFDADRDALIRSAKSMRMR